MNTGYVQGQLPLEENNRLSCSCCCSVAQWPLIWLCDPMDCSMPSFPVDHYLLEFAQAHVHWVADAIQPSHPLSPPSDLALSLSMRVFSNKLSSVAQSCLTLCDPMDCSMPGFPVHHQLLELAQTHAHWVSDVIQPSHLLSPLSPSALNLSQHQGLFQWVSILHQLAKVLEFQL